METRKRPDIKLTGGPHGIPRAVVHEVQRGRLIDAMIDVIAEEGYAEATVRKVLQRAGISRRTFYELFTDKSDCFLRAYEEVAAHTIEVVDAACRDASATPEQRIEAGLRGMLELFEREPKLARACVVEAMAAGDGVREVRAQTMQRLTAMVADALAERCDSRAEALIRGRVLTGGVHELVYDRIARGKAKQLSGLAEDVVAAHLAPAEPVHGR